MTEKRHSANSTIESVSVRDNVPAALYFVGAGGIGMTNLERYYLGKGSKVGGYDRTPSDLTQQMEKEGAALIYEDNPDLIPEEFRNPEQTLVVYTPAVPSDNHILTYFRQGGFTLLKRAALLGQVTRHSEAICVAGSHGKTTTSSMVANILRESEIGCNAFLGGILRNTGSNLVLTPGSGISVIEADEYDRSFHHLSPQIAIVTSTDPDHLDIYGNEENYLDSFAHFTSLIRQGGTLILHTGLKLHPRTQPGVKIETYSANDGGDWHAEDIRYGEGSLSFTLTGPYGLRIEEIRLGVPVEINIDNAVAAAAAALTAGATAEDVRHGLSTFKGARRRFETWLDGTGGTPVLIDDYAHSPNEVKASIASIRKLYPGRELTVIFQPHLYTRTRDFATEFASALSDADRVIMPEIYPAREEPIEGVDSHLILNQVQSAKKIYCERKDLLKLIKNTNFEILMTLGAADIDRLLPEIKHILEQKESKKG
ncbi:MAG: UDP-N-acetylmuramate--L-alanine ligase [Bacteroidales bacterium]|nr:UDP-N-acetylmuramate--L-alanine ligase [Bacteroidales bacterium]